jgi:GTP cyclohydrolase I
MANDPQLGNKIHEILKAKGIETPISGEPWVNSEGYIDTQVFNILTSLGLDLNDDSLKDTPKRVAKMFCYEVFEGLNYENFPKCTAIENKMGYDEVILVRNNVVRSTCEHHLQPIYGRASIAYIPDKRVLGLSKFARVVDFFASRPQVQERLTEQVHTALSFILGTEDIAVVVEADHFCMRLRGVEEACSDTITSKLGGRFRTNDALRAEVMGFVRDGHANVKL